MGKGEGIWRWWMGRGVRREIRGVVFFARYLLDLLESLGALEQEMATARDWEGGDAQRTQ